jgi:hypothetical protein
MQKIALTASLGLLLCGCFENEATDAINSTMTDAINSTMTDTTNLTSSNNILQASPEDVPSFLKAQPLQQPTSKASDCVYVTLEKGISVQAPADAHLGTLHFMAEPESCDALNANEARNRIDWAYNCGFFDANLSNEEADAEAWQAELSTTRFGKIRSYPYYPVFGKAQGNAQGNTTWQAPIDPDADCDFPAGIVLVGFAKANP